MPTSSIAQFKYQPEKIQVGTVYHYTKSNLDGTYPARIYIRVMDRENLDVWKFEAHNTDAAHVTAHMDWNSFSADHIQSFWATSDGKQKEQAALTSSYEDASFSIGWRGESETIQIGHFPVHVYNFDFISLNFILRHWSEPESNVEIGVVQPNFDRDVAGLMKYDGVVTIKYLGDDERNGFPCRKYSIGGEGLQNQQGLIWLEHELMHVVDMEIPIADNPDWNSFKFALVSTQVMDDEAWSQFMDCEIKKLKPVE